MTLDRPFRISVHTLVGAGLVALTTALGSTAWLIFALGAFVACLVLAGLRPGSHLGRGIATGCVVVAFQAVIVEVLATGSVLVPAAHFLLIIQLIWLTQERTSRNYGWMCLLSLLQMMLAGVLSVDLVFGVCLAIFLATGVLTLLLFNLRCELERNDPLGSARARTAQIGGRLILSAAMVAIVELVLAVIVFMYFPRFGLQILQLRPVQKGPALSGFSDRVHLGDLARILDNPEVVMSVRLLRRGVPVRASGIPLLWRGISLDTYDGSIWSTRDYINDRTRSALPYPDSPPAPDRERDVVQEIALEPVNSRVLFHLDRLIEIRSNTPNLEDIRVHRLSLTYSSAGGGAVSLRYIVRSRLPKWPLAILRQPAAHPAGEYDQTGRFTQLPPSLLPSPGPRVHALAAALVDAVPDEPRCARARGTAQAIVDGLARRGGDVAVMRLARRALAELPREPACRQARHLAEQVLAELPPGHPQSRVGKLAEEIVHDIPPAHVYDRVKRIEAHLRTTYAYSRSFGRVTPGVDPVEDFLFNKKRGHCEHFAAAMVVLLRSLGIPSRMVTGFKGGEWNEYGDFYIIRQRDAHAWVEVRLPVTTPFWVSFDPTPPDEAAPTQGHGWFARLTRRLAYLRLSWNTYIVNYSSQDQQKLARAVTGFLSRLPGFLPLWGRGRLSLGAGYSAIVLVVLVVPLAALGLLLYWAKHRLRRGRRQVSRAQRPAVSFYRRMDDILRRRGFRRAPATTPLEFARAVIAAAGEPYHPVEAITLAFCRVRYGDRRLTAPERAEVARALAALENAKPTSPGKNPPQPRA